MARKSRDEDLLMEDELTAAFLGDDELNDAQIPQASAEPVEEEWEEEDAVPGQLAVDVYETRCKHFR